MIKNRVDRLAFQWRQNFKRNQRSFCLFYVLSNLHERQYSCKHKAAAPLLQTLFMNDLQLPSDVPEIIGKFASKQIVPCRYLSILKIS